VKFAFVQIARSRTNAKFVTSAIPALENTQKVNALMVGLNQIIDILYSRLVIDYMIEQIKLFPDGEQKNVRLYVEHDTTVDNWIREYHYLHSVPAGAILRFCFKNASEEILGCMMWGRPTSRKINQKNILELTRMYFVDDTEAFIESKCLSMARKYIRKHCPNVKGLIAYSSTGAGHEGIVYQADNWYALGGQKGGNWENREHRINRDLSTKIRWTRSP